MLLPATANEMIVGKMHSVGMLHVTAMKQWAVMTRIMVYIHRAGHGLWQVCFAECNKICNFAVQKMFLLL